MRDELEDSGQRVGRKRVQRLMRQMGLRALYPRRRTSQPEKGQKIYSYRLRGLSIERANHAWATDICYIPTAKGFMYLVAIVDWHPPRLLSPRVSNTMDTDFCVGVLEEALRRFGAPDIFEYRPGPPSSPPRHSQTCSRSMASTSAWTVRAAGWNVFVEGLWRSVKNEDGYLRAYETPVELRAGLDRYFKFYNASRRHSALGRRTPDAVYFD